MLNLEELIASLHLGGARSDPLHRFRASRTSTCDRLAQLEARLSRFVHTSNEDASSVPASATHSTQSSLNDPDSPTYAPPAPRATQLDWTAIHAELRLQGLPPLQDEHINVSPSLEAVHASMTAVLLELKRQQHSARALQAAANEATSRELAANKESKRRFKALSREIEGLRNNLQKKEASVDQGKERVSELSVALEAAEAELVTLKATASQLQLQLRIKADEISRLEVLLQDQYDKQSARRATIKANYERIRRALEHSASSAIHQTPSATVRSSSLHWKAHVGSLTAWHVAEIYEHQLEDAHNTLRLANAELFLLRQTTGGKDVSSSITVSCAAREVARARQIARRAKEQVKDLEEELSRRPDVGSHERLKREADIMARRCKRLEGWISPTQFGRHPSRTCVTDSRQSRSSLRSPLFVLPRAVACDLLEEIASIVGISDPFEVPQAAKQLKRDSEGASQLQTWVYDVCRVVFDHVDKNVRGLLSSNDPTDIPEILENWVERLKALEGVPTTSNATEETVPVAPLPAHSNPVHTDVNGPKDHFPRVVEEKGLRGGARNPVARISASRCFPEVQIFVPP